MKRYFDEDATHYLVLVDEAHNLVDRSKDMYSAFLDEKMYLKAKASLKGKSNRKIKNALSRVGKIFEYYKDTFEFGTTKVEDFSLHLKCRGIESPPSRQSRLRHRKQNRKENRK